MVNFYDKYVECDESKNATISTVAGKVGLTLVKEMVCCIIV